MSLRSSLLATLLLGDQYGLQLHGEIVSRTARATPLNVGQIYSTLERLAAAGLVRLAGQTGDGLTLYSLTPSGRAAAETWTGMPATPLSWSETTEQLLLVSSLPGVDATPLVAAYREAWVGMLLASGPRESGRQDDLGAARALAQAAVAWLDSLDDLGARQVPLARLRPRRGRRPAA
ncbi:PadR family transcriptional regulator [Frondihabitans cladoniiphilus]|uniref:Transcription regulator PadR N-terminal domain-containing protein n=1 Tax=Frondihabitans cladoniiphilus TaxID=715785 RepID=A0ABP8VN41_9MICO